MPKKNKIGIGEIILYVIVAIGIIEGVIALSILLYQILTRT